MKKIIFLSLVIFILSSADAFAGKRYYIMGVAGTWNTTLSWSTTSGGSSGASVPGSSDTAYFDGNGLGACTLDANVNVKRLEIAAGYTGTIVQGLFTVTIGTSGATLSGGTFLGGTAAITCTGAFTISGCAFTSTSGTFSTNSNLTLSSGSFAHNNGRMKFTATCTITGSISLYDFEIAPSGVNAFNIASGTVITVNNNFYTSGSNQFTINTGTIDVKKDIYLNNTGITADGGTGLIRINGTTKQTIDGPSTICSVLPHIEINKTDTLVLEDTISTGGNFTYISGAISPGTSTVLFKDGVSRTISGSITLWNVAFNHYYYNSSYTIASGTTITVNNNLTVAGSKIFSLITGSIHVKHDFINSNTNTSGGGTALIVMNGSGTQKIQGSTTASTGRTCSIQISKSASDTLKIANYLTVVGNWTYSSGIVDAGTSTIYMYNTKTISGSHTLNSVTFTGSAASTFTIASGTTLTIAGTMETAGGANVMSFDIGNIHVKGDVNITNTASGGAVGTATVTINGTVKQTLTGSTVNRGGEFPNLVINKSDTLVLTNIITIRYNYTYIAGVINAGTSTVYFDGVNKTISGTHALYNVLFYGANTTTYTIESGTVLTVNGLLSTNGGSYPSINTGTIHAKGNISFLHTGTAGGGGTGTIIINGDGEQTLTGSGTAGSGRLPNLTIDKTSGTLTLASIISVNGNWTYVKGTVSAGTSSVALYGTYNLDGQTEGASTAMQFYRVGIQSGTRTLTGNLDVNDNLTSVAGTTLSIGNNNVKVGGNWNLQGNFTQGSTSLITFDGSNFNKIQGPSGSIVTFKKIAIDRRAGSVKLVNPVKIDSSMTFLLGRVKTDTINYLEFADNATCIVTNDDSAYVHGPVRKVGDDAFTFPLGDTTLHDSIAYHPLAITTPGSITDRFQAQYFAVGQTVGDSIVDSLTNLSSCENWVLKRQVGTSEVIPTLSWNKNSCNTEVYGDLRVANWNGAKWTDLGASAIYVYGGWGTVKASSNTAYVNNTAYLTTATAVNYFPYAVLKKKLDGGYYKAINGRLFFKFDEEYFESGDLNFTIYNDRHEVVSSTVLMPASIRPQVVYGDNRYHLNTVGCDITPNGALGNGFYILEVVNDKGERWYLRFEQYSNIIFSPCPPPSNPQ